MMMKESTVSPYQIVVKPFYSAMVDASKAGADTASNLQTIPKPMGIKAAAQRNITERNIDNKKVQRQCQGDIGGDSIGSYGAKNPDS